MPSPRPARRTNGKRVAIAMVALWALILVAVYVVIVRLKLGGEEGIMRDGAPAQSAAQQAPPE